MPYDIESDILYSSLAGFHGVEILIEKLENFLEKYSKEDLKRFLGEVNISAPSICCLKKSFLLQKFDEKTKEILEVGRFIGSKYLAIHGGLYGKSFHQAKDMYVSYNGFSNSYTKFGHFKVPYGLEILTSSRYIPFPERYYGALAFKLHRRMAIEHGHWGKNWNVRTSFFGQTFDGVKDKTKNETGGGFAARVAVAPINTNKMILHVGGSAVWERPDDESWLIDFKAEPETKIGDFEIIKTPKIKHTNYDYRLGLEGAFVYDNFHLQGEYQLVNVYRFDNLPKASFYSTYVYLLWDICGGHRKWDNTQGEFGQYLPQTENKLGAWELALRYSYANLSDDSANIYGGVAANYTMGINFLFFLLVNYKFGRLLFPPL